MNLREFASGEEENVRENVVSIGRWGDLITDRHADDMIVTLCRIEVFVRNGNSGTNRLSFLFCSHGDKPSSYPLIVVCDVNPVNDSQRRLGREGYYPR